jgi:long-chain acyl-CoA synthetase
MCTRFPENTAVVYLGERFSYARLMELINRFATALHDLGVKKDDRVMIYISNSVQFLVAFYGIQKLGAQAVPVSPIYTSHEIEYIANDCEAETILCLDTNFCYVKEIISTTSLKRIIVTNLVDLLPVWKKVIGGLFDKIPHGKVEKDKTIYTFNKLLKYPPAPPKVDIDPLNDISYILYTGGTTGFPKGVPLNHMGVTTYMNDMSEEVLNGFVKEGEEVYLAVNPLFHIMAFAYLMILGLNRGNTTILMPIPQVDAILDAVQRNRAGLILGVPAMYRMILENDRLEQYDLSSLRYCFCGGDVLPMEVFRRWKERAGVPIYQVFGSTEVGFVSHCRLDKEPDPNNLSVGRPLQTRKCMIVDPETLEPVVKGESGELLVTSEHTIKSYLNKPEETARAFVEIDDTIYYRMGDYVWQDDEGDIHYMERSADIIKYKGYRVSASEIEATLQDHETVIGACVVGVPDERVGERIKAIVVLKEDARGVGASDLIKFCRERLAPYKIPRYIEFRDMLPKSKVGKLLRREIRDEEHRRVEKETRITV